MVNAQVETMDSFSAHADRKEILDFIANQRKKAKKIFLVHGEIDRQEALRTYLQENKFKQDIEIPKLAQEYNLD